MKKFKLFVLLAAVFGFAACSDDDVKSTVININTNVESPLSNLTISSGTFTFENLNNGTTTNYGYPISGLEIIDGLYNITFIGKGSYNIEEGTGECDIQGVLENVSIIGGTFSTTMNLHMLNPESGNGFLIKELFLPGTYTATNSQYRGDQYVIIYNNSNNVLYADGLAFVESSFNSTNKLNDIQPDISNEAMAVQAVAVVPGNGKDYPVKPGESFIICDTGINHKEANASSCDLSKADFEWYIESNMDVDSPTVPNLDILYCYTKTIWLLSKQGNRSYAIGRIPQGMTSEQYMKNYTYDYSYYLEATGARTREFTTYKFPNSWIIDAVNLSPTTTWEWNFISPTLDMGRTYIGETSAIAQNIGKAVIRKVAYKDGEREVLLDTNNSSVDFIPATKASKLP